MAIVDSQLYFSDSQDIDASAGSTNVIDLQAVGWNSSKGFPQPVRLWLAVDETFVDDSGSDGTITVALRTDSDATVSSGGVTIITSRAIPVTALVAGADLSAYEFTLPEKGLNRYVDLYYTVASMSPSAGELSAGLTIRGKSTA